MGKDQTQTQTTQQQLDPILEQYRNQVLGRAQDVSNLPFQPYGGQTVAGADPRFLQGLETLTGPGASAQYGQLANLGFGALQQGIGGVGDFLNYGGPTGQISDFYNPFEQNVIGGIQGDIARAQAGGVNAAATAAQRAGAFGGSRHALAEGTAASEAARSGLQQIGQLRFGGHQAAQQALQQSQLMQNQLAQAQAGAAGGLAGLGGQLGFGGLGGQEDIRRLAGQTQLQGGDYLRNIEQQRLGSAYDQFLQQREHPYRQLGILQGGLAGVPITGTNTQTITQEGNLFQDLLGLGGTIGGFLLGGPAGAAAGSQLSGAASNFGYNIPSAPQVPQFGGYSNPYFFGGGGQQFQPPQFGSLY